MASQRLDNILKEVRELNESEYLELRQRLAAGVNSQHAAMGKSPLDEVLLAHGIISRIPTPLADEEQMRFNAWKPVQIQGKPLSETIIEDRR